MIKLPVSQIASQGAIRWQFSWTKVGKGASRNREDFLSHFLFSSVWKAAPLPQDPLFHGEGLSKAWGRCRSLFWRRCITKRTEASHTGPGGELPHCFTPLESYLLESVFFPP